MNKFNIFLKVLVLFLCNTSFLVSASAQQLYKLVTSTSELEVGKKYIFASMANGDGFVMNNYVSGTNCKCQEANSSDGLIAYAKDMAQLELGHPSSGVWTFKDSSNKYMSITSKSGKILRFISPIDSYSKFSISIENNGKATVSCNKKKDNQTYFVCFTPNVFSSYTTARALYLYKEYNPAKVVSLSISGTPQKTVYIAGETPSSQGLNVIAYYDDNTRNTITGLVDWSFSPLPLKYTTTELTATATYEGISAATTFPIKVSSECSFPLDMTTKTFVSADENNVVWKTNIFDIVLNKGTSSTRADYFAYTLLEIHKEIRAYKKQKLIFTPKVDVYKIVITASEHGKDFPVNDALLQDSIKNAKLTKVSSSGNYTYITLTPTVESKPIEITLTGTLAIKRISQYYRTFTTTIGQAGYATLCLPYAAKVPEGVKAYGAKDDGQMVTLIERGDNTIAANEGVVLHGQAGIYEFIAAENKVDTLGYNDMVGVLKDTPLTAADNAYLLTRKKSDGKVAFRLLQTDYTLGANKAFLKSKVQNPGRELLSVYDAVETDIDAMEEEEEVTDKNRIIYNIAGQRMSRVHKGINIVNGKLVIR